MTKSEVAARIKKELGIKVTPHNVHGAAKTIGVSFYLSRGRNGGVKNDRYQALLEFVCLLAETLGEPIPESLRPKHDQNGSH